MQPNQQPQQSSQVVTEETPILDKILAQTCERLDRVSSQYKDAMAAAQGRITRAMILADGLEKLRAMITPALMDRVMKLQDSKLGFRTDKAKEGGYPPNVVKECLIEALLRGVYPVGNEFNIIAGNCYVTKEGYQRLVREIPGLTDLEESPGTPVLHNQQTVVRYSCRWRYNGNRYQLTDPEGKPGRVIPIRVNQAMGVDAILGKAQRKALKAVYEMTLGSDHMMPDGEVDEGLSQESPPTGRMNLRENGPAVKPVEAEPEKPAAPPEGTTPPPAETNSGTDSALALQLQESIALKMDEAIDDTRNWEELIRIDADLDHAEESLGQHYPRLKTKIKEKLASLAKRANSQGGKR
jgi:hypothetical protein